MIAARELRSRSTAMRWAQRRSRTASRGGRPGLTWTAMLIVEVALLLCATVPSSSAASQPPGDALMGQDATGGKLAVWVEDAALVLTSRRPAGHHRWTDPRTIYTARQRCTRHPRC